MMPWKLNHRRRHPANAASQRSGPAAQRGVETLERRVLLAANAVTLLADASVRNDLYADTNFGAAAKLVVQTPVTDASDTQITFLKFDISNVVSISSATLALKGSLAGGNPAITVGVFAVADTSWVEGTRTGTLAVPANGITWNTQPAIGDAIPGATATITSPTAAIHDIDLTSYLQQQKQLGNNVISLAIESLTDGTGFPNGQKKKAGAGIVQFDSKQKGVAPAR